LLTGYVDGLIFLGQGHRAELEATLGTEHIPIVMFGRPHLENPTISFVDSDNVGGARRAVEYLASNKHREHIATITGLKGTIVAQDRLEGYKHGLEAVGLEFRESLVAEGDFTRQSGEDCMNELLDRNEDLDAVFAASDLMAVGALHAIQARGLRVPQDIAVMGFDGSPLAESTTPRLTTVRQPFAQMAKELVAGIRKAINGEAHQSVVVDVEIIECEST
jgi:DNA-binding LacI/PurR family transcriptional regulator